jgi:5-methylcytosine-specific restriction endonuclease McrA
MGFVMQVKIDKTKTTRELCIEHGISRQTAWRARQRGWFANGYHTREINSREITNTEARAILRDAKIGVKKAMRLLNTQSSFRPFQASDLVQEALLRLLELAGHEKFQHPGWRVNVARNATSAFIRQRVWRKEVDLNGHEWEMQDDPTVNLKTPAEMQAFLNQRGAGDNDSFYEAFRIMRLREEKHCAKCRSKNHLTIHHILPRRIRTINTRENTAVLCRACHDRVDDLWGMVFQNTVSRRELQDEVAWKEMFKKFLAEDTQGIKVRKIQSLMEE